jgi:hypothetical protein
MTIINTIWFILCIAQICVIKSTLHATDAGGAGTGFIVERLAFDSREKCIQGRELLTTYLHGLARSLGIRQETAPASTTEIDRLIATIQAQSRTTTYGIITVALVDNLKDYRFIAGYLFFKQKLINKEIAEELFFTGLTSLIERYHKDSPPHGDSLIEKISSLSHFYKDLLEYYKNMYWQQAPLQDTTAGSEFKTLQAPLQLWSIILCSFANDLEDIVCIQKKITPPAHSDLFYAESELPFFAPPAKPAEKTTLECLQEAVLCYFQEKKDAHNTAIANDIMTRILPPLIAEMKPETFVSHLTADQHTLLCHATNYTHCAKLLQKSKLVIIGIMKDEITLSQDELTLHIQNLIYALSTDLLYSHLQDTATHHEHRVALRKLFALNPGIEWHQDIVKPKEIPAHAADTSDPDSMAHSIVAMVKRWSVTHIIYFWHECSKKSLFNSAETLAMDAHLTHIIMPLDTYSFNIEQQAALMHYDKQDQQITKIGDIKKQILARSEGFASTLLTELFHQLMTRYLLDVFNNEHIRISLRESIRRLYIKPLEKKKVRRHKRK